MKTRTPQLQKQSKLKADSLLKQQQHAIVVKTQTPQQQHPKKKQGEQKLCRGRKKRKNEKTNEGDDEIRRLVEERRNTVKGDKHHLKELSKKIKKCIRDKKNKTTRKDTADSGGIQRRQKYIMHNIWKEKNAHPESAK